MLLGKADAGGVWSGSLTIRHSLPKSKPAKRIKLVFASAAKIPKTVEQELDSTAPCLCKPTLGFTQTFLWREHDY